MDDNPLGKETYYPGTFDPDLLVALPRSTNRNQLSLNEQLPFVGEDIWHAYEISWLNKQGLPKVAIGRFAFSCESPFIIESKSFKLFLNSLNQETFDDKHDVINLLTENLSHCASAEVKVTLFELEESVDLIKLPEGICLDSVDVQINNYQPNSALLTNLEDNADEIVEECLYSDLFKSNCPVTNQPDWGTISINYKGPAISHAGLLAYLISYRLHSDYHENCIEKIFVDIQQNCNPQELTVQGNFLRRGGLDINPVRSTDKKLIKTLPRFIRQ
ncbi:NADPH-dependent 7-cyano-7-deazaguanine reductase QueF [Gammaproteobacteria bacterium]|jgi:7-cyano-7-deazaguanine reductase|nr:NADPH-dependent 7-cyano-7-deazaguanine reductase QueF [Gammaproteobacteria bacterium]